MSKLGKIITVCIIIIILSLGKDIFTSTPYQGSIPDPIQINVNGLDNLYIETEDYDVSIDLLAEYNIEAVIKSKKKYTDYSSQIAQYDLALAWGDLNQEDIDDHIKYSQRGRWYYYNWDAGSLVSGAYIAEHSSNVHIISEDDLVLKEIKKLDVSDHIKLTGYLVNVTFDNGVWKSSLTRTDTGDGACELMYVTNVEILDKN
jgi:hypothetical protein